MATKSKAPRTPRPKRKMTPARKAEQARGISVLGYDEDSEFPVEMVANSLWKIVDEKFRRAALPSHGAGKARRVEGPEELWDLCVEYFSWAEKNPLMEAKAYSTQNGIKKTALPKMRAFTIQGLCLFLGIDVDTWWKWRNMPSHKDLHRVVSWADSVIYEQKFSGAASDLLNSNIITRDLGLADRKELSGPEGGPIETTARDVLLDRLSKLKGLAKPPSSGEGQ